MRDHSPGPCGRLRAELSGFVGRRAELGRVRSALSGARLVTLTGPGGIGKTRLAVQAATEVRRRFRDGAWMVELAGLRDPALLTPEVARTFGLLDQSSGWAVAALADNLAGRQALLVLDNCEHLLDACAVLSGALLRACPELRILATSRQVLGVAGEVSVPVPPMSVPAEGQLTASGSLLEHEAVRLFAERGAAVLPGFAVDAGNQQAIAELCRRLEGIPLAIELAAVRLRAMSPEQILARIENRFGLLSMGDPATPRHETLQAALTWSYDLLATDEQALWRRSSVFTGSFDLDAAESVCSGDGIAADAVADLVDGLVAKSVLLRRPGGRTARYGLLDTIREYGKQRLREAGPDVLLSCRHRDWYAALAARQEGLGARQIQWIDGLDADHDNLRAALEFCLAAPGEAEAGLRMACDLWVYWETRGHRRRQRDQRGRHRLGDHRARGVGRRTDHDLPALAAPAGLPRQPALPGGSRWELDLRGPDPAAPVRRIHHRQLGRILGAVGPGRRAHGLPHGAMYCLVVPGRPRTYAKAAAAVVIAVFGLARLYLAVDHPDDVLFGVALGVAVPVAAFRYFTPNEIFPVVYRRGRTAHVDVGGRRGDAIRLATRDQFGLTAGEIKPVGLESSAGSTPLRLRVEGGPEEYLFAKLYTKGHVRADSWYKMWRMIRCGSLEDEHPFQTVRRLTEYEDYALRLLQDAGIAVARPYGIVEITPEREYLLVTEYFDGAVEIGGADVDDQLIDQGLSLIRTLWDTGIAHRDIKPGNLMVRSGQLLLIDVAFAQVRPSPWRQAVDLGNMMLVLAVRTDPARVYRQALNYFSEAELAEAFAATRGVASPTQLRAFMKRDPRDLLAEFRKLAPQRQPIVLQRWSIRRVTLAAAMLALFAVAAVFGVGLLLPASNSGVHAPGVHAPECGTSHTMILAAQAVPSAAFLPCIAALPSGWTAADPEVASGQASFVLNSGQPGLQTVTITLTATCDTAGAQQIPSDQPGMRRFERPLSLVPAYSGVRYYTFPGGCATYRFVLAPGASPVVTTTVDTAVAFMPRSALVGYVRRTEGLAL